MQFTAISSVRFRVGVVESLLIVAGCSGFMCWQSTHSPRRPRYRCWLRNSSKAMVDWDFRRSSVVHSAG